jgi:hypothetical protein
MDRASLGRCDFESGRAGSGQPPGPGKRYAFSNDLVLERYDNKTPGRGLPQNQQQRLAGTHSGFVTTVRLAVANDPFFPAGTEVFEYEDTYKFNTVPNTPLEKGQVTAKGVFAVSNDNLLDPPATFAITGGTGPHARARGEIIEGNPTGESRLLNIEP